VAANHLIDHGWSVELFEAQPEIGGAVRSGNDVHPDFVHDTFSAFYPLAAVSPTIRSFGLEEHGLAWTHAPAVLGHMLADGEWALLDRDRNLTAAWMDRLEPGDGAAWLELCSQWDAIGDDIVGALLSPFPPVKFGARGLTHLRAAGGLGLIRMLLTPAAELGRSRFGGEAPRILLAGNAGHADIPLNAPGSGLMGVLMAMMGQTVGFPVPVGGAGELARALARRFESLGGIISRSAEVTRIDVDRGRAVGVRLAEGGRRRARRAVLADVVAPRLYGGLVPWSDLPVRTKRAMRTFELDPGTVKVDWALDGPIPWKSKPARDPGTVHVADSVEQMSESLAQVSTGTIPSAPFLLVGQMTTTDPTRSPTGTESVWAYTHVPQRTTRDAGEEIRGVWDHDDRERFADRMQGRLEELAPGFGSRILKRRVLGPVEMETRDANLIGGSINGGTSQLHQQLVFRPIPGGGRAETPIAGLYLASASAHPGGGVHGTPGMNAARAAIAHERFSRLTPWRQ
jgi:phytoene dehydrogenase-like protein